MSDDELRWDERGLLPAVVQDVMTGQVRMLAYMSRESLAETLASGAATFFSRSRNTLWKKGETSGHVLHVRSIHVDCDADTILLLVDPIGPSCHTGRPSCFFRTIGDKGALVTTPVDAAPFLDILDAEIAARATSTAERSYTKSLLDGGPGMIGAKLREEADELGRAISHESEERVVGEAADVVYHLLVGLRFRGVPWRSVVEELARRSGTSGIEEKARRK